MTIVIIIIRIIIIIWTHSRWRTVAFSILHNHQPLSSLVYSELYVLENTEQPAVSWSSWLSAPIRVWCRAGEQFNRRLEGFVCWSVFWRVANTASLLSPMTARMSGRPDFSTTDVFVTKSDHWIPRMRRLHCIVKGLQPSAVCPKDGPCVSFAKKSRLNTGCVYPQLWS